MPRHIQRPQACFDPSAPPCAHRGAPLAPSTLPGPRFRIFHLHARFHFQEPEPSHGLAARSIVKLADPPTRRCASTLPRKATGPPSCRCRPLACSLGHDTLQRRRGVRPIVPEQGNMRHAVMEESSSSSVRGPRHRALYALPWLES